MIPTFCDCCGEKSNTMENGQGCRSCLHGVMLYDSTYNRFIQDAYQKALLDAEYNELLKTEKQANHEV